MIGQTISHYKILAKLGEGGMGVVYKAYDTALKRHVALKFLPSDLTRDEDARKRFIHEARAAAALDHPNICAVHEIGQSEEQSFIVMPLVEGLSLRDKLAGGPLPVYEALDVALQVGRGLSKAHGSGIVHRDIKPGNVLLSEDGQATIVDFGLAKLATQTRLTKTGMTVGTVGYMSPEQAKGEGVDHRTDVWSLGVMLYEMLTGRVPFRGDADPAVVYSILNETPEPVTGIRREVPVALEDVVERALSKNPDKRFETMDEMLTALETVEAESQLGIKRRRYAAIKRLKRRKRLLAVSTAAAVVVIAAVLVTTFYKSGQAIDSLVVLPLENLSRDEEQEIFAAGITGELITNFSWINGLKVKSRSASMRYINTDKSAREIAEELDVKVLVGGMIQFEGDNVRITADLIDGSTEEILWSDTFESSMRDIRSLLGEIAQTVADEIHVNISPEERGLLAADRPLDPAAHKLYLKGLHHYGQGWTKKEEFEKAIEYFQQAVEIDPNYAEAYAMLADSYGWLGFLRALSAGEARSKADQALQRALEIDDMLPEAHNVMAGIKHYYDWDWVGAVAAYKRALTLDPSLVGARWEYALLLSALGRFEEAVAEAKRALDQDPLSFSVNRALGEVYYLARQYDKAIAQYRQTAELDLNQPEAYWMMAGTYAQMGRYEDAVRANQKAMTLMGDPPEKVAARVAVLDSAYNASGPRGYWMWKLENLKGRYDRRPYSAAQYFAQLGDKDQAFAWLEEAYEQHTHMENLKVDPRLDPLRDDPRFDDLLRRMNFPED